METSRLRVMKTKKYALGIDMGTTKVAAVILNTEGDLIVLESQVHGADISTAPGFSEQNISVLVGTVRKILRKFPEELKSKIQTIGLTGQMHGVILLNKDNEPLTPLISWQDNRCSDEFLRELNRRTGHVLKRGYGCSILAWFIYHKLLSREVKSACTVQDYMVSILCGNRRPVTDATNAASWGLFDLNTMNWDFQAIKLADIPKWLFPKVFPYGAKAGNLCVDMAEELGIPYEIPVSVAIGDNQASLLATLKDPTKEIALTLGTGAQLSVVVDNHQISTLPKGHAQFEYRPYPEGKSLAVAASLNGGSAWAWLADQVEKWLIELGLPRVSKDYLYKRLNELGLQCINNDTTLEIKPIFYGERFDSSLRSIIAGIGLNNFDLGNIACAMARGIIENLRSMLPNDLLNHRERIVGSGNALRRTPLLQAIATEIFNVPIEINDKAEESACGAAINAMDLCHTNDTVPPATPYHIAKTANRSQVKKK